MSKMPDMVKRTLPIVLMILLFMLPSCMRRVENSYETISYVDSMLSDSLPALQRIAKASYKPSGAIFLIGEPLHCLSLSEQMMSFDEFDNVDAKRLQDGLPDFAGETIVSILDFANSPYDSLYSGEKVRQALREVAVRDALAALDTTYHCKVLIVCSPQLAEKGGDDISDFFEKIGCDVPVLYSKDTTFSFPDACYKIMREKNLFTHNIAYPVARLLMTVKDSNRPPFTTIGFEDRLVPEYFADTVGVFAPNTFVSYVQNKHKP